MTVCALHVCYDIACVMTLRALQMQMLCTKNTRLFLFVAIVIRACMPCAMSHMELRALQMQKPGTK
jgi:hypothetical protein